MSEAVLRIERLGERGEGVARDGDAQIFVPFALAGETVRVAREPGGARLVDIVEASPDRRLAFCPHYGICGGCAVQTLAAPAYAEWKRGLLRRALANGGVDMEASPLVDAHGAGRRRVTFHARFERGETRVGFMQARSHHLVEIEHCPLLARELADAPRIARGLALPLARRGKPLDLVINATQDGLDVDLRGAGPLDPAESQALLARASELKLARLSNHGALVALLRAPRVAIGDVMVAPPPGAFLQATQAGEEELARRALDMLSGAKRVADLFCGVGSFALRIARRARVDGFDSDAAAVEALAKAARASAGLRLEAATTRDLFKRPLLAKELGAYDAVIFDPPRAGAQAQAQELARSTVRRIVAVSCNAQSFARDAALLIEGGYRVEAGGATPIDQFRHSPHVEIIAAFSRVPTKTRRSMLER